MTADPIEPLLSPQLLAGLGNLQIIARRVADSVLGGIQRSRHAGAARDFSNYRHYQPGDDLRQIDWKLYARSDRHYVREAELDRSRPIRLFLDATASMAHAELGTSKWNTAKIVAGALAYLARAQGDPVGLEIIGGAQVRPIAPSRDPLIMPRILHALNDTEPSGRWPSKSGSRRHSDELVFVITDLHESSQEIQDWLQDDALRRNEVTVVQISAPGEEAFDFTGNILLEDLETGQELQVDAAEVRARYLAARTAHQRNLFQEMARVGVRIFPFRIDEPLDQAIRRLLAPNAAGPAGLR